HDGYRDGRTCRDISRRMPIGVNVHVRQYSDAHHGDDRYALQPPDVLWKIRARSKYERKDRRESRRVQGKDGGCGRTDQTIATAVGDRLRQKHVPRIVDHQPGGTIEPQQIDRERRGDNKHRREPGGRRLWPQRVVSVPSPLLSRRPLLVFTGSLLAILLAACITTSIVRLLAGSPRTGI